MPATIISEFEIIPGQAEDRLAQPPAAAQSEPQRVIPSPDEIIRVQRLYRERRRRLRAD